MFKFWKWLLPVNLYILDEPPVGGAPDVPPENPSQPPANDGIQYPDGMDESLKGEASLKLFLKDNKFDYAGVLKSYVNAQKMLGKEKVVIPSKNATEDDWNNFYNKIGRPELDKYAINLREGQEADEAFLGKFKEVAHKSGLLPKQAEALFNWYHEEVDSVHKSSIEEQTAKIESEHLNLKKEWGFGYDKEIDLAKRALRQFASEDEIKEFKEAGLTGDVRFIKFMNKIGKGLKEDSFKYESAGNFGITKEEASRKISEMYSNKEGPYLNKSHSGHKQALHDMLKLNEILYS